jgi:hypothetical protein
VKSLASQIKDLLRTAGEAGRAALIDNAATCEGPATASRITRVKTMSGGTYVYRLPEKSWREVFSIDSIYLSVL